MNKQKKQIVKLYCFIYEIEEDQMYRQDDDAEFYKGDYFYHDDEYDETIYVQDWKIDNPQYNNEDADKPFIYMYSLNGDVNHAMELMHKSLEETVEETREKLAYCEKLIKTFEEKQEYIKNKYPSTKEQGI